MTEHPDLNIVRIATEERRFQLLDDKHRRRMIRFAPHPREPHSAVEDQLEMNLKEQGYAITLYQELIEKLQDVQYRTI